MRKTSLLTFLLTMVALGCQKSQNIDFPNVRVDEVIYLNNPSSQPLNAPGGWIYNPGGHKGLIVYRRFLNGGPDDFIAFDRGCPEHYEQDCGTLNVTSDDVFAQCGCNDEKYILFDGSPADGANRSMIIYRTTSDGQVLRVFN